MKIYNVPATLLTLLAAASVLCPVLSCSSSGTPPDREETTKRETEGATVPISLTERRFVELTVDVGEQSSSFLLYPSLTETVVFRGTETGFNTDQPFVRQRTGSEREVLLQNVRLGSMSFGTVPALLMKRDQVKAFSSVLRRQELGRFEGVLGYNFLRNTQLTLHYPDRKLRVKTASPYASSATTELLKPGKTDFEPVDTAKSKRMITFQAGVNGNYRGTIAVDLGLPVNLIDRRWLDKWQLKTLSSQELRKRFGASSSKFDFVSLSRFWISGNVFENVLVRVREDMKQQLGVDAEVILGNYFFTDKVVQINFPRSWIAIQSANESREE